MTPNQFRKIALSHTDTIESQHVGHPDFRIGGKIFASLGAPDDQWAMVKLTPAQQQVYLDSDSTAFQPCSGAWGRQGYTNIKLADVQAAVVRTAIALAIENVFKGKSSTKANAKPTKTSLPKDKNSVANTKKVKATGATDSDAVDSLLLDLEHPLKSVIEKVRSTILSADSGITEGIKWNSPSFYFEGWFATFHLRTKDRVLVVLHHGAKVRNQAGLSDTIDDPAELLTWLAADRATISFASESDFKLKRAALKGIIKQWIALQ